jgi:hypothetical protein
MPQQITRPTNRMGGFRVTEVFDVVLRQGTQKGHPEL